MSVASRPATVRPAGALRNLLSEGGLTDIDTRVVKAPLELSSANDALEMIQQAFGAYRAVIADLNNDKKAATWPEVLQTLEQFEGDDGFRTEFEFIVGSGSSE